MEETLQKVENAPKKMEKTLVKVIHFSKDKDDGRYFDNLGREYTVAMIYDKPEQILQVGIAITNPKDRFTRDMGSKIALGKAENKPFVVIDTANLTAGLDEKDELTAVTRLFKNLAYDYVPAAFNPVFLKH